MKMEIVFPGGERVDAVTQHFTISTDQTDEVPAPFDLFLASIGTCTGHYVASFCRKRGIPLDNIRIEQRAVRDPQTRMFPRIELELRLPADFPGKYRDALLRSAELCSVKKHLDQPPEIDVRTRLMSTV